MRRAAILLFVLALAGSAFSQTAPAAPVTAQQIVSKWRAAVHAGRWGAPQTAILTSTSDQDGIPGKVHEWLTTAGDYRAVVTREYDDAEVVLTARTRVRRNWNGFLRGVEGEELSRWQAAVFEASVLVFGPPQQLEQAEVSKSEDGKLYLLKVAAPGGKAVIWSVDAQSWLPVKSVRPGEDSEITTTYSEWRDLGGVLTPTHGHVTETDKPDYTWERSIVKLQPGVSAKNFAPPQAGPSDVHMDAVVPPIPFDFDSAHIIFQASLNGSKPIWWILDTGADEEYINSTRLADFGLKPYGKSASTGGGGTAEYGYATGATFTLPGVELRNQHVAVLDQTGLERALGLPLGGLLGYEFISRFVIEIYYEKKLLTLHDPATWKYAGNGFIVPVVFDTGIPFTHGSISVPTKSDIPAFFVIDFGAAETMTLTSPFVKANDLVRLAQTNAGVNKTAGLENQFFTQQNVRGRIQKLKLGRMEVDDIPINM